MIILTALPLNSQFALLLNLKEWMADYCNFNAVTYIIKTSNFIQIATDKYYAIIDLTKIFCSCRFQ